MKNFLQDTSGSVRANKSRASLPAGFTLIELLVVIAIIGILASIILASLATARIKGVDAAVKSDLDSVNSQMEIFNQGGATGFGGGCTALGSANPPGAATILAGAASQTGSTVQNDAVGVYNKVTCNDIPGAWAVQAPLSDSKSGVGNASFWCVDSSGDRRAEITLFTAATTVCPAT